MSTHAKDAVSTLMRVDPAFIELAKTLYGPDIDAEGIWSDVFKAQQEEGNTVRRVGLASTMVGGTLGVKDLHEQVPLARAALKAGTGAVKPTIRAAVVGGTLVGDGFATAALRRKRKQMPAPTVIKALNSITTLKNGSLVAARKLVGSTAPAAAGGVVAPPAVAAKVPMGQKIGRQVGHQAKAPATGAALATTGFAAGVTDKPAPPPYGWTGQQTRPVGPMAKSADIVWEGTFSKFDDDKHLAFGWASVVKIGGLPVKDRQGDEISEEDIEKAAYEYVLNSRIGGDMHKRGVDGGPHHVSDLVESMVFTDEKVAKMGLPDDFPRGWWVGQKIHDDGVWQMVKKGERSGFSIHGTGKRTPVAG